MKSRHRKTSLGATPDSTTEFHNLFAQQYQTSYPALYQALTEPVMHVALVNPFISENCCAEKGMQAYYAAGPTCCYR